jgi:hypothetical protein
MQAHTNSINDGDIWIIGKVGKPRPYKLCGIFFANWHHTLTIPTPVGLHEEC